MEKELFKYSNHLGFFCPYFFVNKDGKFVIRETFKEIFEEFEGKIEIDAASIASILNTNFIIGDRTLIKGIYRSPWMAYPNDDLTDWIFHEIPAHGNIVLTEREVADRLFTLLCEEILEYVGDKKRIGILLSGGMDSRMVAGALDYLVKKGKIHADKIIGYTWGNPNSRDVVYAQRITERLDWEWKHFEVKSDDLLENLRIAADEGCEYSGIHLHSMPKIGKDRQVDLFLAGSYGDSVGRAEYSGRHVTKLKPIHFSIRNFGYLLRKKAYKNIKATIDEDVQKYHSLFPREEEYQQRELDYQLHYMRRMLNPCMETIHREVPLFQVFTSPKVFGFMWSLSPELRNNNIYVHLMDNFVTDLSDIPWARTGKPYGKNDVKADEYDKKHHSYSYFIESVLLKSLRTKNMHEIVNYKAYNKLIFAVSKAKKFNFHYLEAISWIYSFSLFSKKYQIPNNQRKENITDLLLSYKATVRYFVDWFVLKGYQIKKKLTR